MWSRGAGKDFHSPRALMSTPCGPREVRDDEGENASCTAHLPGAASPLLNSLLVCDPSARACSSASPHCRARVWNPASLLACLTGVLALWGFHGTRRVRSQRGSDATSCFCVSEHCDRRLDNPFVRFLLAPDTLRTMTFQQLLFHFLDLSPSPFTAPAPPHQLTHALDTDS